MSLFYFLC